LCKGEGQKRTSPNIEEKRVRRKGRFEKTKPHALRNQRAVPNVSENLKEGASYLKGGGKKWNMAYTAVNSRFVSKNRWVRSQLQKNK